MARGDYLARTGGGYGKSFKQKSDNLKQSIGSLDRRINNAIASGNTDQAKDLRSKQKNFVKDLAMNTVKQEVFGGDDELTVQGNVRTSSGGPLLTTKGGQLRQSVIDRDFLNPTRRLQNQFPAEMKKMYPISQAAQQGPFALQAIKKMFGIEDKGKVKRSFFTGGALDVSKMTWPERRSLFEIMVKAKNLDTLKGRAEVIVDVASVGRLKLTGR